MRAADGGRQREDGRPARAVGNDWCAGMDEEERTEVLFFFFWRGERAEVVRAWCAAVSFCEQRGGLAIDGVVD